MYLLSLGWYIIYISL